MKGITTMHNAYIIVSTIDETRSYQTIYIPEFSNTQVLHREYSGQRGRGSAWRYESVTKVNAITVGNTNTTMFSINDKELLGLKAGIFTSIGVKAQQAMELATPANLGSHNDVLNSLLVPTPVTTTPVVTTPIETASVVVNEPAPTTFNVPTKSGIAVRQVNLATVPDKRYADEYLNRVVVETPTKKLYEFDIFDMALEQGNQGIASNVLIQGHAGSGKTMASMAYASARGLKFYSVSAHAGIDVSQVFGKLNPTGDPETPFAWFDGGLTQCVREGNAVLLFNEINFLPERFTTVVFSLLDDRREISLMDKDGEVVKAGKNLLIIGDMNPNYRGTRQLNQAFADRFSQHRLVFEYDPTIERKLIPNPALLEMANQLRARFDKEELTTPISTRSLVAFYRNLQTAGYEYAKYSYLNSFSDIERPSVALVIETHESNIKGGN